MKLWNMLYSNLMNEEGGGEGAPPAGANTNNPMGNAGDADYLNDDPTPAVVPPAADPVTPPADDKDPAADDGKKTIDLNDGKGLLDEDDIDDPDKKDDQPPAPTDADYKFDLPDGFDLSDDVKQSVIDLAKEANVSPEVANKFVQKHAEIKQQELADAKETIEGWRKETVADPEIGGDYLQQTMKNVNNALNAPAGAEVAEILKQTGLQNHPAIIKLLNHYGKMAKTDSVRGVTPVTTVSDKQKLESFYND